MPTFPAASIVFLAAVSVRGPQTLDDCEALVRAAPRAQESYTCFRTVGQRRGALPEAARRLEGHARSAHGAWASYTLGLIAIDTSDARAPERLRAAAERFERDDDPAAAALAHEKLAMFATNAGRFDEADTALDLAEGLARRSGRGATLASVLVQRGWTELRRGNYAGSGFQMRRAQAVAGPDAEPGLRQQVAGGLAAVSWMMGRMDEAARHYREQVGILVEMGDADLAAFAMGNLVGASKSLVEEGTMSREELAADARRAVIASEAARQPLGLARAHVALAQALDGDEARRHAREALRVARASGSRSIVRGIAREAGYRLVALDPSNPEEGLAALEESLADGRRSGSIDDEVRSRLYVAATYMEIGDRARVIEANERLFAAIEDVRDLQQDARVRAGAFAAHALAYHRYASHLVASGSPSDEDLSRAFEAWERMRARVLLDRLDGARAAPSPAGPLAEERGRVLDAVARARLSLADPSLPESERESTLLELERLGREEASLRRALAERDPGFAAVRDPDLATISGVAAALRPGEAMLAFGVATERGGGSWVVAIDPHGGRVHPLPAGDELDRRIALLLGLIERRDDTEAGPSAHLGEALLGTAVEALGASVTHLVIVPDGSLWRLPWDALRIDGERLGERYVTTLAPSATAWLRWRGRPGEARSDAVLAFADAAREARTPAAERASRGAPRAPAAERLGPLPGARDEARSTTGGVGRGSLMLVGEQATERALKTSAGGRFGILHLAVHAVVDEGNPERSAVVLADSGEGEDGLLYPAEIAALDLRGYVVLLTACRGASGSPLRGEGPLTLVHSFFRAGARAVVGSLWPLRDDEAVSLVDSLARELERGRTVADALAEARRISSRSGAPAHAWAGLVVFGDGAVAPLRDAPGGGVALVAATAGLAIVLGGLVLLLVRRSKGL